MATQLYKFALLNQTKMRILLIGANGAIGKIISPELVKRHELLTAGRNSGTVTVDIASPASIENMFKQAPGIDACVCVAGDSYSEHIATMDEDKMNIGIINKLMGQINLVLIGQRYLNENGSITLISGKMGDQPAKNASGKAVANGGINSFVMAASLDMQRGIRINVVSPAKIADIPAHDLINAYLQCIETAVTGQIIKIGY